MKIKEITAYLEHLAPLSSQEDYDNCGLLTGNPEWDIDSILLTLDCTEAVIQEAIEKKSRLIIAHHPIIFGGMKRLNGKNYIERTVIKAIKHDIAIYAIHTNLDNYFYGVNHEIGRQLGLGQLKILRPSTNTLSKLAVYCPQTHGEIVTKAMFEAGAGHIGNYDECSYETSGTGQFRPLENTHPTIGASGGKRESVEETKIEVICPNHLTHQVIHAVKQVHPYEEVAYDIIPLWNKNQYIGAGMIGELPESISTIEFLERLKTTFNCGVIKHTELVHRHLKKIAFCGGSGAFLIQDAIASGADIYITGDLKYHEYFDAEDRIILADIGHFESEQFTPNLLSAVLKKKFINFAVYLSKVNTNPVNYF